MRGRLGSTALVAGAALCLAAPGALAATALTFSYSEKTADMLPLWIAADAGYFTKHGLDVTVRYLPAQEGVPALLTNEVQMAAIGGPDAISAVAQGAKLKFVLTLSPVNTFQLWARPQNASAAKLKGQQVGVPSTTGSAYAGTVQALKELGLATSDVAITSLGSVSNVNSALLAGSIAAAVSHAPATYQFQKNGLVDLVDLAKKKMPSINAGMLLTDTYVAAHPGVVQAAVDAVTEGIAREMSDRAFADAEMAKYIGVKDKPVADFTYDYYVGEVVHAVPLPEATQLAAAKAVLGAKNPKVRSVDLAAMIDQRFVRDERNKAAAQAPPVR
jgi:NitT/TauT family transport system substrate-binding protein